MKQNTMFRTDHTLRLEIGPRAFGSLLAEGGDFGEEHLMYRMWRAAFGITTIQS